MEIHTKETKSIFSIAALVYLKEGIQDRPKINILAIDTTLRSKTFFTFVRNIKYLSYRKL